MKNWQLHEAKAHFSKVVKEAIANGPQAILFRGEPSVVVLSQKEYNKLTKPTLSFVQFMRESPLVGSKIRLKRQASMTRKIDL